MPDIAVAASRLQYTAAPPMGLLLPRFDVPQPRMVNPCTTVPTAAAFAITMPPTASVEADAPST